jgi:hypothetical protein
MNHQQAVRNENICVRSLLEQIYDCSLAAGATQLRRNTRLCCAVASNNRSSPPHASTGRWLLPAPQRANLPQRSALEVEEAEHDPGSEAAARARRTRCRREHAGGHLGRDHGTGDAKRRSSADRVAEHAF